ncbi:MAG: hypothetical protein RLZZ288_678 [Planctomycetota bacterium]
MATAKLKAITRSIREIINRVAVHARTCSIFDKKSVARQIKRGPPVQVVCLWIAYALAAGAEIKHQQRGVAEVHQLAAIQIGCLRTH